jgi:hypothetical protein
MKLVTITFMGIVIIGLLLFLTLGGITLGARNQIEASPLEKSESPPPYMEYQVYNNTIIEDPDPLPVLPGGWGDYSALFDKYNLCELVANDTIDEIWIWAGNGDGINLGHLLEWTTSGPGWEGMTPNCGEVVTTMVYNYTRNVNLHAYAHRMEGLMRHYEPCDFSTATWPWDAVGDSSGDFDHCGDSLSNIYGFVARPFAENNQIAGCGDVHFPPNIIQGDNRDYIYHESRSVDSICPDWSMDGTAVSTTLNCQNWGCSEYGYMIWWLQNFPGYNNNNRDRDGGQMPNWWAYLFDGKYIDTQSAYKIFLPSIIKPANQSQMVPSLYFSTTSQDNFNDEIFAPGLSNNPTIANKTFSSQEALVRPVVFVINLTAYEANGSPIDDVATLNSQMIAAAKEATIYHGYLFNPYLQATFLGQDGGNYAGTG